MKINYIILFSIACLLNACMRAPEKHKDFMSICDCFVYEDEVKSESIPHGWVEFIDTSKASGCAKAQLQHVFLLYYDTICIAVYNQHPKDNFKLIESLIKKYHTDTTELSDFVWLKDSLRVEVNRLCTDESDKHNYNRFVEWRVDYYEFQKGIFSKTKEVSLTQLYKWKE